MEIYNKDGELVSIDPKRITAVINATSPAIVSVRGGDGSELTITDIAIDVRPNGIHILLDTPEACFRED